MIYLDHAATTAAYPEVVSEMTPYLDRQYFNPSGSYREGRLLHKKLDKIREKLAAVIHASPEEIIFTSGGTEADNWVLLNAARTSSCKAPATSLPPPSSITLSCTPAVFWKSRDLRSPTCPSPETGSSTVICSMMQSVRTRF